MLCTVHVLSMLFLRAPVHTHLDMFISYTALIDVCTACIMLHVLSCPCVIFSGVIWKSEQSIRPIEKYQCLPINELTKAAAAHKHAVQVNTYVGRFKVSRTRAETHRRDTHPQRIQHPPFQAFPSSCCTAHPCSSVLLLHLCPFPTHQKIRQCTNLMR